MLLGDTGRRARAFRLRDYHPLWSNVPDRSAGPAFLVSETPGPLPPPEGGFGLVRVRSPLLTESLLLSFPPVTKMFQFTGFASPAYAFSRR